MIALPRRMKVKCMKQNKRKFSVLMIGLGLMALVMSSCQNAPKTIEEQYGMTFRLAESHPDDYVTNLANLEFARLVNEKTEGRISILVYANKELGEERSINEQVQFGAIDFARVSIGPLSEFVPRLNLLQLPFLYEDEAHMWRVLNSSIGDELLKEVEKFGYIGLTYYDGGARSFYNRMKPIERLSDIQGMNIRVMESGMMVDMVQALGINAVAMQYGDVYSALQRGSIDGAENNFSSYESSSHYEVAKFYTLDEHVRVPEMLIGSQKALESLSEDDLRLIKEAAEESQLYQRKLWQIHEAEAMQKVKDAGIEIHILEDKSEMIEAVASIYSKYGQGEEALLSQIYKLGNEANQ